MTFYILNNNQTNSYDKNQELIPNKYTHTHKIYMNKKLIEISSSLLI